MMCKKVRLMRITTALGLFAETGKQEYAHTSLSRAYLDPAQRGYFLMAQVYLLPLLILL